MSEVPPPLPPPPPPTWIIRPEELQLEDETAIGGAPDCTRPMEEQSCIRKSVVQAGGAQCQFALHSRGELWTSLQHANVLQMFGVSPLDADPLYVVIQFQPDGNVTRFLEQHPQVDRVKIVSEVALGMQYLHGRGVVHGSLKPTNILIRVNGKACISDYGMIEVQTSGSNGHRYFSPEAWKGTISRPSDVFAWAMCAVEIFTNKAPWGILSEKQIFRLVVRQDSRPDRPDEDFGLTDQIWSIMEKCWLRDSRQRPTFEAIVQLLQNNIRISTEFRVGTRTPSFSHAHAEGSVTPSSISLSQNIDPCAAVAKAADRSLDSRESLSSHGSRALSTMTQISVPPAYEVFSSTNPHAGSAPPTVSQFRVTNIAHPHIGSPESSLHPPRPYYAYEGSDPAEILDSYHYGVDEERRSPAPMFNKSASAPLPDRGRLAPSPSIRTSSSGGSSRSAGSAWTSASGGSSRSAPNGLKNIGEEPMLKGPRSLPTTPSSVSPDRYLQMPPAVDSAYEKHRPPDVAHSPSEYSGSTAVTTPSASAESVCSEPSTVSTTTAPNATLLAGALLSEVKEGRNRDVIDPLLVKIQKLGVKSHKDAQKLVTAGTIPTLILLLKTRAVDGIGLETVLIALGILTHDPITANTIFRTSTTETLIEIVDAAQAENIAALAVWCLARMCRNTEIANGLLKQNLGRLLVTKGLRAGNWRTARMAAWCLGALIRTDGIAEMLADMGLVPTLCEHLRRCSQSATAGPEEYCAAIYAVARISRSIKIAKALASGGCAEILAKCLNTAENPQILLWSARAVGCLMRPNSSDMAKSLLDAGVARGLARLPSMLPTEEVEPLGAFAFAIQRFSCAEWGGGTRKALVDAGVVDALLAALRTAADEPYPQVHIELANAIALLGDVGGTSIRKEIVNAGGIDILKRVGNSAAKPDVTKACNQAATSITGNVWSRNAGLSPIV
ncbi:Protein kinase domain-containing protein [Mycena venus]|uniref:Protein kinase domain-containing protein n=1 Tax=Mycena venus TaxID=2733690 RepID=A0A8H7CFN8_9AGAR|nr:Protein kinase domain-containing protein [Mycena venus]